MWKELKKVARWTKKTMLPDSMLDEQGEEVRGKQAEEVWERAFHLLGIEDLDDEKFDAVFARKIEEEIEAQ